MRPILELRLVQPTLLRNALEALSHLAASYADFAFSGTTGLEVQAVDTSGFPLAVLQLHAKQAFDRYSCDRDRLSIGLNLATMAKAFSCFADSDDIVVTIKLEYYVFEPLTITFESPDGGMITELDLDLADVNNVPLDIPEHHQESEYQATVRMPSAQFMRVCSKLSSFTDNWDRDTVTVRVSVNKERVEFFTCGAFSSARIVVRMQTQTVDKPKEATLIEMKEVSLSFALRHMNSFSKASTLSDQVTIKLSSNMPAVFEYKIAEMGYVRYYMLPSEYDEKGDETQGVTKEDKMHNEGDEMQD